MIQPEQLSSLTPERALWLIHFLKENPDLGKRLLRLEKKHRANLKTQEAGENDPESDIESNSKQ